jgi:hypothetical protein
MDQKALKSVMLWMMVVGLCATVVGCDLAGGAAPANPGITQPAAVASNSNAAATATGSSTSTPSSTPTASAGPTEKPASTATLAHLLKPGEPPPAYESQMQDLDSSGMAAQLRVLGGDGFGSNIFERPFNQDMKTYFASLDLKQAGLGRDATWTYATLKLAGATAQSKAYGLEIDVDRDGRGDFLVMAAEPGTGWSTDGVSAWQDKNGDVGGAHPLLSDAPPQTGDGYETRLFSAGQGADSDLAWARISPGDPAGVQIAFKRALFNDANPYLWGAWAMDAGLLHADWFDYNDHFTLAQAGSPLGGNADYPLKAFFAADNTCRWAMGFTPTGNEPGICPVAQVLLATTPTFTRTPSLTPARTYTLVSRCFVGSTTNPCPTAVKTQVQRVYPTATLPFLKATKTPTRTPTLTPTPIIKIIICGDLCD